MPKPLHLRRKRLRCRLPSPVLPVRLRLGDPLALALEHHLTLELPDGTDDRQQELASPGIHAKVQNMQVRALPPDALRDLE
jgi:hypothetical protein